MLESNPLLQVFDLPPYADVRAEHLVPAIEQIISDNHRAIAEIVASQSVLATWDDLVLAMDELTARLDEAIEIIETLGLVAQEGDAWNNASSVCAEAAQVYRSEVLGNLQLFLAYQALADSPQALNFDVERKAALKKILRTYRLAGIALPADEQARLARLNREILALEGLFMEHLQKADSAWSKHIVDVSLLAGIPEAEKQRMAQKARTEGHAGWLITLDHETYRQIMTHAEERALRQELFIANATRASDRGPHAGTFDNGPVLELLLANRHEKAVLLGFANFAEMTLASNSAESTGQVTSFLRKQLMLEQRALVEDAQALVALAAEQGITDIQAWDHEFFAQKLRFRRHGTALSELRDYFPLDRTLLKLCLFSERLFGIRIIEQKHFSRWHESVRLLEIREHGEVIGHIYIDPFYRKQAHDFAWTATPRNRRVTAEGQVKLPFAILYGNFAEGVAELPCLLDHLQLRTLFHEFGHCLQQVLTRSPYKVLSGILGLEGDTAEFAGQLFEHWCLSREFLLWLAAHYQTAEQLPEAKLDAVLASINLQNSWQTARVLMGAIFDFELHRCYGDGRSVQEVFADVQAQFPQLRLSADMRLANGFDYMVTGYGASVYAYEWSEVLATRAFKKFEEGWVFSAETGKALREAVFAVGDSRPLLESLEVFLGQPLAADFFTQTPSG